MGHVLMEAFGTRRVHELGEQPAGEVGTLSPNDWLIWFLNSKIDLNTGLERLMNSGPINLLLVTSDGHVLVLPKAPCRNIFDAPPEALKAVALTTQKLSHAVKAAFDADGLTIQQFNESAGGQVVFHLHVHVMPRFEGVALRPHTGAMEKPEILAAHAEKIRAALKNS